MRRTFLAFLSALFVFVSCIPWAAADTAYPILRKYPGFSDVAGDLWCYEAVKPCYETGLLNGTSSSTFSPNEPLTREQLIVLSARLYHLRKGGDGSIPALPKDPKEYVRLYDSKGTRIGNLSQVISYSWSGSGTTLSAVLQSPLSPSAKLNIQIGFDGDSFRYSANGTASSTGKSMSFSLPEGVNASNVAIHLNAYSKSWRNAQSTGAWNQWWFPASYYLDYREDVDILYSPHWSQSSQGDTAYREDFALWLFSVCGKLTEIRKVNSLPDVPGSRYNTEQAEAIFSLYEAGILAGVDATGAFRGTKPLTRAQAAVMLARILNPALRISSGASDALPTPDGGLLTPGPEKAPSAPESSETPTASEI